MSPALMLSLVVAIFCGSLFHAIAGRQIWQWPLFVATSIAGFFGGFLAGVVWNIEWLRVGDVPMLIAITGALATTALAWFFSAPRASSESSASN